MKKSNSYFLIILILINLFLPFFTVSLGYMNSFYDDFNEDRGDWEIIEGQYGEANITSGEAIVDAYSLIQSKSKFSMGNFTTRIKFDNTSYHGWFILSSSKYTGSGNLHPYCLFWFYGTFNNEPKADLRVLATNSNGSTIFNQYLQDFDTNWHSYTIIWNNSGYHFYIDNVYKVSYTQSERFSNTTKVYAIFKSWTINELIGKDSSFKIDFFYYNAIQNYSGIVYNNVMLPEAIYWNRYKALDIGNSTSYDYFGCESPVVLYKPVSSTTKIDDFLSSNGFDSMKALHPSSSADRSAEGQCFTCEDYHYRLTYCVFKLGKVGSPEGNAYAKLYLCTGTYGSTGKPTGSPLAISNPKDVSYFGADYPETFIFEGENQYLMQKGVKYCIIFFNPESGVIDSSNYVKIILNTNGGHGGNMFRWFNNDWSTNWGNYDLYFSVYGVSPAHYIMFYRGIGYKYLENGSLNQDWWINGYKQETIIRAYSLDGLNWVKEGIVIYPELNNWKGCKISPMTIFNTTSDLKNLSLWIEAGYVGGLNGSCVGYFTSSDYGYNWTSYENNPIFTKNHAGRDLSLFLAELYLMRCANDTEFGDDGSIRTTYALSSGVTTFGGSMCAIALEILGENERAEEWWDWMAEYQITQNEAEEQDNINLTGGWYSSYDWDSESEIWVRSSIHENARLVYIYPVALYIHGCLLHYEITEDEEFLESKWSSIVNSINYLYRLKRSNWGSIPYPQSYLSGYYDEDNSIINPYWYRIGYSETWFQACVGLSYRSAYKIADYLEYSTQKNLWMANYTLISDELRNNWWDYVGNKWIRFINDEGIIDPPSILDWAGYKDWTTLMITDYYRLSLDEEIERRALDNFVNTNKIINTPFALAMSDGIVKTPKINQYNSLRSAALYLAFNETSFASRILSFCEGHQVWNHTDLETPDLEGEEGAFIGGLLNADGSRGIGCYCGNDVTAEYVLAYYNYSYLSCQYTLIKLNYPSWDNFGIGEFHIVNNSSLNEDLYYLFYKGFGTIYPNYACFALAYSFDGLNWKKLNSWEINGSMILKQNYPSIGEGMDLRAIHIFEFNNSWVALFSDTINSCLYMASSPNLTYWQKHGTILPRGPLSWERMWATSGYPILKDNHIYIWYEGGSYIDGKARIGYAFTHLNNIQYRLKDLVFRIVITKEPILDIYLKNIPLYMGIIGLIMLILSPSIMIIKIKEGDYNWLAWGFLMAILGIGMVIGWLST